jgi:ADP-ribosylglycohydrolase/fructose-1,6-bisphosphatase/inositol monophosphatase family enzyme
MGLDLERALDEAIAAAREAGEILRHDLHRAGGPRGRDDKADADVEAEQAIRARLLAAVPGWGFVGEEMGETCVRPGEPIWLVDPDDGTRDYLCGWRGSAVSIGLLAAGRPRLGVVFAFAYPDDAGDLFAWAEGCGPVRRNGRALERGLPRSLDARDVVLVSSAGDSDTAGNLACVTPARFRAMASVAHRLALVAAGEAAAAVSLNRPHAWDYAAGHALLCGAGGTLMDEQGREVTYSASGRSHCARVFGGSAEVAATLGCRPWHVVGMSRDTATGDACPARLRRGESVSDAGRLGRAQGCLLGQIAGDNLGGLVEFQRGEDVRRAYADGPRHLEDGGVWGILAGQPTDDSEMALALARSIVAGGGYERGAALEAYRDWMRAGPFDVGSTVRAALQGRVNPASQANGSLMRISPLAVFAHALPAAAAAELARQDGALTHPNPVCGDAAAAFVVAISHAIGHGEGGEAAWHAAVGWAREAGAALVVREALEAAADGSPVCDAGSEGWVKIALQNAFHELLHAPSLEEGVVATVRRGGDTDTNAAIAGALLGAVHGRDAVPQQWRSAVLSCRPHPSRTRVPRPRAYWPVDVLEVAERLLLAGRVA